MQGHSPTTQSLHRSDSRWQKLQRFICWQQAMATLCAHCSHHHVLMRHSVHDRNVKAFCSSSNLNSHVILLNHTKLKHQTIVSLVNVGGVKTWQYRRKRLQITNNINVKMSKPLTVHIFCEDYVLQSARRNCKFNWTTFLKWNKNVKKVVLNYAYVLTSAAAQRF